MKKIKNKKFEKLLLLLCYLLVIFSFIAPLVLLELSILINEKLIKLIKPSFCLGLFCGVIFLLVILFPGNMKKISISSGIPVKYFLGLETFDKINSYLNQKFLENNYILKESLSFDNYMIKLYCKKINLLKYEIIMVINFNESKNDININKEILNFLNTIKNRTLFLYLVPIVIVKEENEYFKKYIHYPLIQEKTRFLLPVAYSLQEKSFYIVKQTCELGIGKYYELNKRIINILDLKK